MMRIPFKQNLSCIPTDPTAAVENRFYEIGPTQNLAGIDAQTWEVLWSLDNDAAKRFYGMGFALERGDAKVITIGPKPTLDAIAVMMQFRCVCGRGERFQTVLIREAMQRYQLNAYQILAREGALSREHLLSDGYTAAEIDAMEARAATAQL